MSVLAHGGPVGGWDLAYVGGVIGLVSGSLYYVRRAVAGRASSTAIPAPSRLVILLGGAAGLSIGLGTGGFLAPLLSEADSPEELMRQLCSGSADVESLHERIVHVAGEVGDAPLSDAHDRFDSSLTAGADRAAQLVVFVEAVAAATGTAPPAECVTS